MDGCSATQQGTIARQRPPKETQSPKYGSFGLAVASCALNVRVEAMHMHGHDYIVGGRVSQAWIGDTDCPSCDVQLRVTAP